MNDVSDVAELLCNEIVQRYCREEKGHLPRVGGFFHSLNKS
jgi:hypothetical protein